MKIIDVSSARIETVRGKKRISVAVEGAGLPSKLYYDLEGVETVPQTMEWAATALIYPAMLAGESLRFAGVLSPMFLDAIRNDVQVLLKQRDNRLNLIKIHAESGSVGKARRNGAATGFSGGVDSFAALERFSNGNAVENLQISRLVTFHNVSTHSMKTYRFLHSRTKELSKSKNLTHSGLVSNIANFFKADELVTKSGLFQHTHSLRNAASAHLFSEEVGYYHYSSTFDYSQIRTTESRDIGYLDPLLLPMLSTETFSLLSACAGMTRLNKTHLIANNPDAHKLLHVCVKRSFPKPGDGFINCSTCWKCLRTQFDYDVIGELDNFRDVFDVDWFREKRKLILKRLESRAINGDINTAASLAFAKEKDLVEKYGH